MFEIEGIPDLDLVPIQASDHPQHAVSHRIVRAAAPADVAPPTGIHGSSALRAAERDGRSDHAARASPWLRYHSTVRANPSSKLT